MFPDDATDQEISAALEAIPASNAPKSSKARTWTDTTIDFLPAVGGMAGGIIGGIGGTVLGMGVGGAPGAVGGAALGGATGEAAKELINRARGAQAPATSTQAAQAIGSNALNQAGMEATGAAVAPLVKPALQGAGKWLMQSAMKPGVGLLSRAPEDVTPPVIKTLLKEGISVTPYGAQKLGRIITASNQEIKDALAAVPISVNPYKVAGRVVDTAKKFATQVNPDADVAAVEQVGAQFLKNRGGAMIPGQVAQDLKTGTYRVLRDKYGELSSAATEGEKALARGLKEEIASEFAKTGVGTRGTLGLPGGVDITAANAREGRAIEALAPLMRRLGIDANKNPGGIGVLAIERPATFLAWLIDRSPAVKSMLANGLYKSASHASGIPQNLIRLAVQSAATSDESKPTGSE